MQRIGEVAGLFIAGDPSTNTKGTIVTADWLNSVQEELAGLVEGAGVPLSASDNAQVRKALQRNQLVTSNASGTGDAITADFSPVIETLTDGMCLRIRALSDNGTTTPTFTPNPASIGPKNIVKGCNAALAPQDINGPGAWIDLQYDATLDKWVLLNPASGVVNTGKLIGIQIFNTVGTAMYTPTTGTKSVIVDVQGGGGGGGGAATTSSAQNATGGGGFSGSFGRGRFTSGFAGVTVTVGAAGAAGSSSGGAGGVGGVGGTSSFGALLSAPGGGGGSGGTAAASTAYLFGRGGNTAAASGANIFSVPGRQGIGQCVIGTTATTARGGDGGDCPLGTGGGGATGGSGLSAGGYGAGGGGAGLGASSAGVGGGQGAKGVVIVYEYT